MNQPLVSIITPSYNQAEYIEKTIESVLSQSYPHIEYIIIDGGSTDNTQEILKKYEKKEKIKIITNKKNEGQTKAINKGWEMSKGSILAYLNSDDTYYVNNAVSLAVDFLMRNHDVGIVYGESIYIDKDGNKLGKYNTIQFNCEEVFSKCLNPIPQPSAFIQREVINKIGYFDENLRYVMDWDFWLRAGFYYKIAYIPHILSTYRLHPSSKSVSALDRIAPEIVHVYAKLFSSKNLPGHLQKRKNEIMGQAYLKSANYYFGGRNFLKARQFFIKALSLDIKCMNSYRDYIKLFLSAVLPFKALIVFLARFVYRKPYGSLFQ